jgi:hypothetical protein
LIVGILYDLHAIRLCTLVHTIAMSQETDETDGEAPAPHQSHMPVVTDMAQVLQQQRSEQAHMATQPGAATEAVGARSYDDDGDIEMGATVAAQPAAETAEPTQASHDSDGDVAMNGAAQQPMYVGMHGPMFQGPTIVPPPFMVDPSMVAAFWSHKPRPQQGATHSKSHLLPRCCDMGGNGKKKCGNAAAWECTSKFGKACGTHCKARHTFSCTALF